MSFKGATLGRPEIELPEGKGLVTEDAGGTLAFGTGAGRGGLENELRRALVAGSRGASSKDSFFGCCGGGKTVEPLGSDGEFLKWCEVVPVGGFFRLGNDGECDTTFPCDGPGSAKGRVGGTMASSQTMLNVD